MSARINQRLSNRVIVVVGPAGKLGPIWCRTILEAGAEVVGLGISVDNDVQILELMESFPDKIHLFEHNVKSELDETTKLFLSTREVSGVVLNAGIDSVPGSGYSNITEFNFENWMDILSVNVAGIANTLNQLVTYLGAHSSVIFIGSMYGVVSPNPELYSHFNSGKGSIKNPAYGASKAALIAMCNQYAVEFAPDLIRFNVLTLGGIEGGQDKEFKDKFIARVPIGRMADTEEVKGALQFLLGGESSYMTGHNLVLDGGYTTW
jgi:NAD(P)-dependent dehydrogenase (short-subunit alcohol dehydrogenase family)